MDIRIKKVQEWCEMSTGQYSVSEGPITFYTKVMVHPDDHKYLRSKHDIEIDGYNFAYEKIGMNKEWWCNISDVCDSGEEGDPLADEFMKEYHKYIKDNYENPVFVETEFDCGIVIPYEPMIKIN